MTFSPINAVSGRLQDGIFTLPVRIYYEDTDAGGIVYYANYLKFAERTRTEFLRAILGAPQSGAQDEPCGFVVRKLSIDYHTPAVLDDLLSVSCAVISAKGASVTMKQEVRRGDTLLADMEVCVAYVNLSKKRPVRLPANLLAYFDKALA